MSSPSEAVAAGDDVGHDGGVRVADVGARVDVVDRGGEVELFRGFRHDDMAQFSRGLARSACSVVATAVRRLSQFSCRRNGAAIRNTGILHCVQDDG